MYMNYQDTLNYLNSFINYEKVIDYPYTRQVLGLSRINKLLEKLGNPHKDLKAIHITGSKGKGSVACFCASILKEAGLKTGLYTSPHLETFRERIRINDEFISEEEIIELVQTIKPHVEETNKPSFFEIYTALAFLYFKKKNVDLAVIEVGLGGRLDATNVINALVCVLTAISFEHTKKLGNTLACIAREKSGIIKEKSVVICSMQEKEVIYMIKQIADFKKAPCYVVGKDISPRNLAGRGAKQIFSIDGILKKYGPLEINLFGDHQVINAAAAVGAVEALGFRGIVVSEEAIQRGLSKAFWPGRIEVVSRQPVIILDGAQNIASASALVKTIKQNFNYNKLILILGISKDKDIGGIIGVLERVCDEVIVTRADLPRAAQPEILASFFGKSKKVTISRSVEESVMRAEKISAKDDLILVCGSLFVVAEARKIMAQRQQGIRGAIDDSGIF